MEEFNNRMDAQRNVLEVINRKQSNKEELCGLSNKAIERWIAVNRLNPESDICRTLFTISEKLFFLATKSQEQVSEKYKLLSYEIAQLQHNLERAIG
jgi:hypothetical protein